MTSTTQATPTDLQRAHKRRRWIIMHTSARSAADRLIDGVRGIDSRSDNVSARSEASLSHYDALLETEAHISGVPTDLLKAICWHASGWRQFEPSGRVLATPTQHGTTYGCMQLNDVWHPDAFPAAMTDAQASIRYAAGLLVWLREQLGDWDRATIAFFGHDRRAELAARRVRKFQHTRPWSSVSGAPQNSVAAAMR
jgi:hypothetical protein